MTNEEFEVKEREWYRALEDIMIDMSEIYCERGLRILSPAPIEAIAVFDNHISRIRETLMRANTHSDINALKSEPGGYLPKDTKKSGEEKFEPGEWKLVDK